MEIVWKVDSPRADVESTFLGETKKDYNMSVSTLIRKVSDLIRQFDISAADLTFSNFRMTLFSPSLPCVVHKSIQLMLRFARDILTPASARSRCSSIDRLHF